MTKKYTPGPWEYNTQENGVEYDVMVDGVWHVAIVCDACADGDTEANARLIACAPELLEALEEAYKQVKELCDCYNHPYPLSSFERYNSIITKSNGE